MTDSASSPAGSDAGAASTVAATAPLERLFSFTGIVPLGAFLAAHLWTQSRVLYGPRVFGGDARAASALLVAIEVVFVFLPIAIHGGYGAYLTVKRRPLAEPRPYPRAVAVMVRATGVVALAFIVVHAYTTRVVLAGARGADLESVLAPRMASITLGAPLVAIFYMVGVAAVVVHFAAGLWGYVARRAPSSRRTVAVACAASGLAAFAAGANVVTYLATGTRLIGRDTATPLTLDAAPCVASSTPPAPSASN